MNPKSSRLRIAQEEDITLVEFLDRSILEETYIQEIGAEIAVVIEQSNNPKVLICFANVMHLSSAALTALISINNKIKQKGGQLRLSNIDPQIREVFAITRLDRLFQIHEDVAAAQVSFK